MKKALERIVIGGFTVVLLLSFLGVQEGTSATFEVINTSDSGTGSLRDAILWINVSGGNTIEFDIPPGDPGCSLGVCTIEPLTPLPLITSANNIINGYTQTGAAEATGGSAAVLTIVIDGSNAGTNAYGLQIFSDDNTVNGLVIHSFDGSGVRIIGDRNTLSGNYIGTDATGTVDLGNKWYGIGINGGAENVIGGDTPAERNVVSGNDFRGVSIENAGADDNIVSGNYVGTSASGSISLGNDGDGVHIGSGAQNNKVGGDTISAGNLISGNSGHGVSITGASSMYNQVKANLIGTDVTGELDLGNAEAGVYITGWSNDIGGTTAAKRNIISGNDSYGLFITSENARFTDVLGNYIGTNVAGTTAIGGQQYGVFISGGSTNNTIGGATSSYRNIISGNVFGVTIWGVPTRDNSIIGNYIGTDPTGSSDVGNTGDGVWITNGAHDNRVGGAMLGQRNVIAGNSYGVTLSGDGTSNNVVAGNLIGTDASGAVELGNGTGIRISGLATINTIGGDTPGERNVISGNDENGVWIYGDGTRFNEVIGNYIGVDITGAAPLGNAWSGVRIDTTAKDNSIGGMAEGEGNVISDNDRGVFIYGDWTADNVVQNNYIGTDASADTVIGNDRDGIRISGGAKNNIIGLGNIITGSGWDGVIVSGVPTDGNIITQNEIYGNTLEGINLDSGGNNYILSPIVSATSMGSVTISGTATSCDGCTIEVFSNPDTDGEGKIYLGSTVVAGTSWSLSVPGIAEPYLTATATDSTDGTSEFSTVFVSTVRSLFLPIILR